ncbi:MAG TPA: trimeric intracellular cation channel family protein [Hanamia sp.]|nr:trimeric intracellular cation channel family protein [Hanamia sp.]
MNKLHTFYFLLDLAGTFAFAISGATAARQKGLDLFGISAIAFIVACGGGMIHDICIGAIPPAGLTNSNYLIVSMAATIITIAFYPIVQKLNRPVIFFDAAGLSLFAVTGAQKAIVFGHNAEVAILLGVITAVGGGVIRDILLGSVPVILQKQIYASAALIGAMIVTFGNEIKGISHDWTGLIAMITCLTLRLLAIRYHWNLPVFSKQQKQI